MNKSIDNILKETNVWMNPYFQALRDDTFDFDDFVETQIQFYFAVVFFNRPMAALAAKIPTSELRLEVIRNVWEEHGEGNTSLMHEKTFLAFLDRLAGIKPEDIAKRAMWPEVRAFNTVLVGACVMDEYLIGVGVMGIIERMFSDIAGWIGEQVVSHGWLSAEKLIHYNLHYYVVLDGDRVVAVAAAVLRAVPPAVDKKPKPVWYLCDLKVHPEYRGRYLPVSIFRYAFPKLYPVCSRAYAVSMDAGRKHPNRVARMLKRFPLAPMSIATQLGIVSLDAERMRKVEPVLRDHFGNVSYLSLEGKKDIILQSIRSRMPLLHVQFGPCAEQGHPKPLDDCVHMFCVSIDHPLLEMLKHEGIYPSATATVIYHGMEGWDWEFILTSDI